MTLRIDVCIIISDVSMVTLTWFMNLTLKTCSSAKQTASRHLL